MTTTKDNEQHSLSSVVFDGGGVAWTQDQRYQGDERDCQNLHRHTNTHSHTQQHLYACWLYLQSRESPHSLPPYLSEVLGSSNSYVL